MVRGCRSDGYPRIAAIRAVKLTTPVSAPSFCLFIDPCLTYTPFTQRSANAKMEGNLRCGMLGFEHLKCSGAWYQEGSAEPIRFFLNFSIPESAATAVRDWFRLVLQQNMGDFVSQIARLSMRVVIFIVDYESSIARENSDCREGVGVDGGEIASERIG